MKRIINQIAVTPESEERYSELFALCNDGTVWVKCLRDNASSWLQVRPVPQPDDDGQKIENPVDFL